MTSATDELRRLLDERGVEYFKHEDGEPLRELHEGRDDATSWKVGGANVCAVPFDDYTFDLWIDHATPAQAIDATLGRGTCRFEQIPEALYDDIECSECGVALWGFQMDIAGEGCPTKPRYCPNCGRKVVE